MVRCWCRVKHWARGLRLCFFLFSSAADFGSTPHRRLVLTLASALGVSKVGRLWVHEGVGGYGLVAFFPVVPAIGPTTSYETSWAVLGGCFVLLCCFYCCFPSVMVRDLRNMV